MKRYCMRTEYGKAAMTEHDFGEWVDYCEAAAKMEELLQAKSAELEARNAELLEACKGLLGIAERHGWLHIAVNAARAAIAKAEGGEG